MLSITKLAILSLFLSVVSVNLAYGQCFSNGCVLVDSPPVVVSADGQIVENLRITAVKGPGILVNGYSDVVIRNVEITHTGDRGIQVTSSPNTSIEDVVVTHGSWPTVGPLSDENELGIEVEASPGTTVRRARLTGSSTGIYVLDSPNVSLSYIEGHDMRGPLPRGQLVQFDKSDNCLLEDFSVINDQSISYAEDNVSVYQSHGCVVRRGLIDGNNGPSGTGVMFEFSDNGLVEDVDAIRMGNGAFSVYPGNDVTMRRTRVRDNICTDQGRGAPLSGGMSWATTEDSTGIVIEDSEFYSICTKAGGEEYVIWHVLWSPDFDVDIVELCEVDFTPRAAIVNEFCWEDSVSTKGS